MYFYKSFLAVVSVVLVGCASTSDIDTSRVEQSCAQPCSHNYSTCVSKFTIFPIQVQHQCTDAFRLCIQGCPERGSSTATAQPTTNDRLKNLKELRDTGAISKKEYEVKRKEILDGV